jgi:hypothetical protein
MTKSFKRKRFTDSLLRPEYYKPFKTDELLTGTKKGLVAVCGRVSVDVRKNLS